MPFEMTGVLVTKSKINNNYFILDIKTQYKLNSHLGKPGQFYEIQMPDFPNKLRIPISIFKIEKDTISFMIKIAGQGTDYLSKLENGVKINILGPLGNEFSIPETKQSILLISGGIGYAPLFFFKNHFNLSNSVWMHGGRNSEEVFNCDLVYTDDGSEGIKGYVTEGLEEYLDSHLVERIYTCGPKIMMKRICEIAYKHQIKVEASLEEYMACGMGVCYGCVVKIKNDQDFQYKTVCKDGPIFLGEEVIWDE